MIKQRSLSIVLVSVSSSLKNETEVSRIVFASLRQPR
jgi:hypothetical protein